MRKKLVLIVLIAAVVIGGATAAVFAVMNKDSNDTPTWREQYDLGVRFLNSGNYEEAVIAFKAAIEIDPRKGDAYIGLADAYIGLGDMEEAEDILTDALSAVRSSDRADIESKLAELDSTALVGPGPNDPDSTDSPEPVHTHVWLDATCTEPRTCSECGATEGEPLGHDMLPATYDAPSTCSRCSYTEGEPLAYNITWTLENGILTISGTGAMKDFYRDAPWYDRKSEIVKLIIENGVTSIGKYAFADCENLTSISIPNSVTEIDTCSFLGCHSLVSVSIPDSVTVIGMEAFMECINLTDIIIPSGVKKIDQDAFYWCTSLTSVTIPDSVTEIGVGAFDGCSSLVAIVVNSGNRSYVSVDGVLFSADMTLLHTYPGGKMQESYIIPSGVKKIGDYAFSWCTNLINVTIPNSVTTIGYGAFIDCDMLVSVTIPDSVTEIDITAFYCFSLVAIEVDSGNRSYVSVDGVLFSSDMTLLHTYPMGKDEESYVIPYGVTTIGDEAFFNCDSLTSVTIPNSVETIGYEAFSLCDGLTSVIIPDSVTTINDNAFQLCENLTSVTLPNSVTKIGNGAFSNCYALTNATISNGVTSIGDWAFISCRNLTAVTIPDSVTTIGYNAFAYCDRLTDIYYGGTAEQWAAISAEAAVPETATVHYSSER